MGKTMIGQWGERLWLLILSIVTTMLSAASPAQAYEIVSTVSPGIVANPIELVFWVKPGVTPENEERIIDDTLQGAWMWEDLPTSCIDFTFGRIVHASQRPSVSSQELLVVVANQADLSFGGAYLPVNGVPGSWEGAVADKPANVSLAHVAAHEIGHAIGFHHSTSSGVNIMFYSAGNQVTMGPDDEVAAALAYPCASLPFATYRGKVRGRFMSGLTPVSGVNVIAVNNVTNEWTVARLSGQLDEADGAFELAGLLPGSYHLEFKDVDSCPGAHTLPEQPADGQTYSGSRGGFQNDNFVDFRSADFSIAANQVIDFGDIPIQIAAMSLQPPPELPSMTTWLPSATVGQPYSTQLRVLGGIHDLTATAAGLPVGLSARIVGSGQDRGGLMGVQYLKISGTPTEVSRRTVDITITDRGGTQKGFTYNLLTGQQPLTGLFARYTFDGNGNDTSGNGHHATVYNGSYVADRLGQPNGALALDGTSTFVQLPNESSFDLITYTLVVIGQVAPGWREQWLLTKGSTGFGGFGLRVSPGLGSLGLYGHESFLGDWATVSRPDAIPTDSWFCFAAAADSSSVITYFNGQRATVASNPSPIRFNDEPVRLGLGGFAQPDTFLKGKIDEVMIYVGKRIDADVWHLCNGTAL